MLDVYPGLRQAARTAPGPAISPYAVLLWRPGVRTVGGSIDHDVIGKDIPTRLLDEGDVLISQADCITAIVVEAR